MTTTRELSLPRDGEVRLSRRGLRRAFRALGAPLVYAVLPALLLTVMVAASIHHHFAFDFHQFWQGGRDVIEGRSPYPPAHSLPTGGDPTLDAVAIQDTFRFPYPAPAALAMAPFGALPFSVAAALFVLLSIAAVFLALRLLGVVDWRCYGLVFASITTLGAVRLGTFTPFLLLGLAVAWRFREKKLIVATAVGGLVLLKLFLWPLLIWLVLSRRVGSAALAVAIATAISLASWAVIGFADLANYPELLSTLASSVESKGWSAVALGLSLGLSSAAAHALTLVLAGFCARGRRSRAAWEARSLVFHGRHSRGDPPFANRLAPLLPVVGGAARDRLPGAGACLVHPTRLVGVAVPGDRWGRLEDRARVGRAYRRVRDNAPVNQAPALTGRYARARQALRLYSTAFASRSTSRKAGLCARRRCGAPAIVTRIAQLRPVSRLSPRARPSSQSR